MTLQRGQSYEEEGIAIICISMVDAKLCMNVYTVYSAVGENGL